MVGHEMLERLYVRLSSLTLCGNFRLESLTCLVFWRVVVHCAFSDSKAAIALCTGGDCRTIKHGQVGSK